MAYHFPGDHGMTSALLARTEINKTKDIATKLLGFQFDKWVHDRKDVAEIVDLLQLHQT